MARKKNQQRIVIKVGTNVLQRANRKLDYNIICELGEQIAAIREAGHEVLLVTSGAVGAGREINALENVKEPLLKQQMLAAIGQVRLMQIYYDFFMELQIQIAQVLLTRKDFGERSNYLNIRNTLEGLLAAGIVPIINENDVVGTEELADHFGDNDQLAASLSALISADKVFFLTTAQGFLKPLPGKKGQAEVIAVVTELNEELLGYCGPSEILGGKGGMASKVQAAGLVMNFGMDAYICSGKEKYVVKRILEGEALGTHFKAKHEKVPCYQMWLASGAASKGILVIDAGAEMALKDKKSLLAAGIISCSGQFKSKEMVQVVGTQGDKIAVGRSDYSSKEIQELLTQKQQPKAPTARGSKPVIHRDHLFMQS